MYCDSVLSPYFFNLFPEIIFRVVNPELGVSVSVKKINYPRYANDTALTADSGPELLSIATGVNEAGKDFGMKMKVMKTKSEVISKKGIVPRVNIESDKQVVEQVS